MESILVSQHKILRRKTISDINLYSESSSKINNYESLSQKKEIDNNLKKNSNEDSLNDDSSNDEAKLINESDIEFNNLKNKLNFIKNKQSNFWFNLIPSYKSRSEEFKKYFSSLTAKDERFIVDYTCAYQRKILAHGRMYVSLNYICFYANIFSWETNLIIKFENVKQINKINTAFVFPNAIEIITDTGKKYCFASFATRDNAFQLLNKILNKSKLKFFDTKNSLKDELNKNYIIWSWIHEAYGNNLGYTVEEEICEKKIYFEKNLLFSTDNNENFSSDSDKFLDSENFENLPHIMCNKINPKIDNINVSNKLINSKPICFCDKHVGELIFEDNFSANVDNLFKLIFEDSSIFEVVQKQRKITKVFCSLWQDCDNDSSKKRNLHYKLQIDHPLSKFVETTEVQYLSSKSVPGHCYMIKSVSENTGIPYSDCFKIYTQWCIIKGNNIKESTIKVHVNVDFLKSSWSVNLVKGIIKSSSFKGIQDHCQIISECLKNWCEEKSLERIESLKCDFDKTEQIFSNNGDNSLIGNEEILNLDNNVKLTSLNKNKSSLNLNKIYSSQKKSFVEKDINEYKNHTIMYFIILILLIVLILVIFFYYRLIKLESNIKKYEDEINNLDKIFNFYITNKNKLDKNYPNFKCDNLSIKELFFDWKQLINKTLNKTKLINSDFKIIQNTID